VPKFYIVPQEWSEVVEVLKIHGCNYYKVLNDTLINANTYKFNDVKFGKMPYEGRFQPTFQIDTIKTVSLIRKGDYIFPTNQNLLGILVYLLEPNTNDSFVKWGFFNAIFEQKEYFEVYSMTPVAEKMYEDNEELRNQFLSKIEKEKDFKNNVYDRLDFFYKNSEYYDKKHNIYPVLKVY
jgi:hypothetical protein